MKLVKESLYEFHKTGDPIGSLGVGASVEMNLGEILELYKRNFQSSMKEARDNMSDVDYGIDYNKQLRDHEEMLIQDYHSHFEEELEEILLGRTITAHVKELYVIDKDSGKIVNNATRTVGKHTFKAQAIRLDDKLFNDAFYQDRSIIIADMNDKIYSMKLDQNISIR